MAHMATPGEESAHFGLFALSGRITAFAGPAVLAATVLSLIAPLSVERLDLSGLADRARGPGAERHLLPGGHSTTSTIRAPA